MNGDGADARDLASFGYAQQLRRRLGGYASFAAGFSFISILTTVFQLRASVYELEGGHWYLQWFAVLFVGGSVLAGVIAYGVKRRTMTPVSEGLVTAEANAT